MAKYRFDSFNLDIEAFKIYPAKTDKNGNAIIKNINAADMTIDIDIIIETENGSKFGYALDKIKVENLTYDPETIAPRIMTRLEDFKISGTTQ